jgi:hypothetical protein
MQAFNIQLLMMMMMLLLVQAPLVTRAKTTPSVLMAVNARPAQ